MDEDLICTLFKARVGAWQTTGDVSINLEENVWTIHAHGSVSCGGEYQLDLAHSAQ
jgi:hypothetical protein